MAQQEQKAGNIVDKLVNEQWRMEEDYKRLIVTLQTQNEKYRNQLYELGETVNKILDKSKVKKDNTPNLQSQLNVIKKELENANKFIEIYKKQLKNLQKAESSATQLQAIAHSEETLKAKQKQLAELRKDVKELTNKNKALEYRLMDYNRKGKPKSVDTAAIMLKQALYENRLLKSKIEELEQLQKKKNTWLKNNVQSTQDLQKKIDKLPSIQRRSADRLSGSLPKLQKQKKIYSNWLQTYKNKGHQKLQKEIEDLQKISKMVSQKILVTNAQIKQIQDKINKLKDKISPAQIQKVREAPKKQQEKKKTKDWGGNSGLRNRKSRRDWVGKFDGLRFSDSRLVREEARVYKIVHNSNGFYQFHYYAVSDKNKTYNPPLPFDPSILPKGKQSTFTVEFPDYIKQFRVKINLKLNKIVYLEVTSNLGLKGEFSNQDHKQAPKQGKSSKKQKKDRVPTEESNPNELISYSLDVKGTQAPICMFGSYNLKVDEKKGTQSVYLQGLGVQLIEDFVEEKL